jgi:hypothetical protein
MQLQNVTHNCSSWRDCHPRECWTPTTEHKSQRMRRPARRPCHLPPMPPVGATSLWRKSRGKLFRCGAISFIETVPQETLGNPGYRPEQSLPGPYLLPVPERPMNEAGTGDLAGVLRSIWSSPRSRFQTYICWNLPIHTALSSSGTPLTYWYRS